MKIPQTDYINMLQSYIGVFLFSVNQLAKLCRKAQRVERSEISRHEEVYVLLHTSPQTYHVRHQCQRSTLSKVETSEQKRRVSWRTESKQTYFRQQAT